MSTAGRFGRRRADHDHQAAHNRTEALRSSLRSEWGTVPSSDDALTEWAAHAAAQRAEHDPHVTEAAETVTDAKTARQGVTERQRHERLAHLSRLHGPENVRRDPIRYQLSDPHRETARWQTTAEQARAEAARLRALPPDQAARQITVKHATAETARQAAVDEPDAPAPHPTNQPPDATSAATAPTSDSETRAYSRSLG